MLLQGRSKSLTHGRASLVPGNVTPRLFLGIQGHAGALMGTLRQGALLKANGKHSHKKEKN